MGTMSETRRSYQPEDPFAGIPNADGAEDYRPSREVQARCDDPATSKPRWLRKIHATGIHGCPAVGCPRCHRLT